MDYVAFEGKFGRREAALALLDRIPPERRTGPAAYEGTVPTPADMAALYEAWLPADMVVCLAGDAACAGPDRCGERCTASYWRQHSLDVASMLERFATVLGEDVSLWRAVGMLHDLDYLRGPHHDPNADSAQAHPLAISTWLLDYGAPPVAVTAVLEHSPHIGQPPSSPLSHALVAADEHATMTADRRSPEYPPDIPRALVDCLLVSGPSIRGFVRDDMFDRAVSALRGLPTPA